MDRHLETPIFVSAIIGLSCVVFSLDNLEINEYSEFFNLFLGVTQLAILGIILIEAKGGQFNPELVDIFTDIIRLEKF